MKIIKKEDIEHWAYKYICSGCDSELEVEASDLRYTYISGDFREPGYDKYSANCPVCSQDFLVPIDKLPKLLQVEVKNRSKLSGRSYFDR